MADYAKLSLLRYRWVGQTINLLDLIGILKNDPNWHKAESYKTLMNALRPIVIETKEVDRFYLRSLDEYQIENKFKPSCIFSWYCV